MVSTSTIHLTVTLNYQIEKLFLENWQNIVQSVGV